MKEDRFKEIELLDVLKILAPGTSVREGLENILKARTGAIIVIGDSREILDLVDGGFFINKDFSPSFLYELAKMDGAIVLTKDCKRILYANALLIPDPSIPTVETGTRHKTAERVARQTKEIVVCISQRRNIISLYKDNKKYILKDTSIILTKANQALQTLEKYRSVLDTAMNNLNILEFEDVVSLDDVIYVIQRIEMFFRVSKEIEKYICELGNEGRLISMQLEELKNNIEKDANLIIEDYKNENSQSTDIIRNMITQISYEDLVNVSSIAKALGYGELTNHDIGLSPKGYRIMNKIPKVPIVVINNLITEFNDFQGILKATIEELDDVEGIGEVRAKSIREGLKKAKDQILFENKQFLR